MFIIKLHHQITQSASKTSNTSNSITFSVTSIIQKYRDRGRHTFRALRILFAAVTSTSGSNSLNNSSYLSTFIPNFPNCFCSRTLFTSKNVHMIFCSTHCRHMGLLPSHLILRLRQGSQARAERCRRYVLLSLPVFRGIATFAGRE